MIGTASGGGLFTAPAVWKNAGATWMFAADFGGTGAWILANGKLEQRWKNKNSGTSPVIAGGLMFAYDLHSGVRVYQPESGRELALLDAGRGHWNSLIVVDGMIALPEGDANDHATTGILNIWRPTRSERK